MLFYIEKKTPEAAGKGGGAVFLGARRLQVWRSRLTEESTRAPHKRAQDARATHRTYDPPLSAHKSCVCGARVLCSFVWRKRVLSSVSRERQTCRQAPRKTAPPPFPAASGGFFPPESASIKFLRKRTFEKNVFFK